VSVARFTLLYDELFVAEDEDVAFLDGRGFLDLDIGGFELAEVLDDPLAVADAELGLDLAGDGDVLGVEVLAVEDDGGAAVGELYRLAGIGVGVERAEGTLYFVAEGVDGVVVGRGGGGLCGADGLVGLRSGFGWVGGARGLGQVLKGVGPVEADINIKCYDEEILES